MKVPQPTFSAWFKKRSNQVNMTHSGFARISGLSLSTINNLKRGHAGYSRFTLRKVLQAFGIKMTVQEFLSELTAGRDPEIGVPQGRKGLNEAKLRTTSFRSFAVGLLLIVIIAIAVYAWRTDRMPVIHSVSKSKDERNIVLFTEEEEAGRIHVGDKIKEPFRVRVNDEHLIVTANYGVKKSMSRVQSWFLIVRERSVGLMPCTTPLF